MSNPDEMPAQDYFGPLESMIAHGTDLASAFLEMKYYLINQRRAKGLTQQDVAEQLFWSMKKVRNFESPEHDSRVSDIRVYALLIGADIKISVTPRSEQ